MKLFTFDSNTLEYKRISYFKIFAPVLFVVCGFVIMGNTFMPSTDLTNNLTDHERYIVINQANVFTEDSFIKEIKSLNFRFPHIVFAQSLVETGNFSSMIFKENNNLFGMKEARKRAHLARGTARGHAYYDNWKHSLYDYAFYYSEYLSDINSEEDYFYYINQRYAEDPNYDTKVRKIAAEVKHLFK